MEAKPTNHYLASTIERNPKCCQRDMVHKSIFERQLIRKERVTSVSFLAPSSLPEVLNVVWTCQWCSCFPT